MEQAEKESPLIEHVRAEPLHERLVAAMLRVVLRATLLSTFRADRPVADQRRLLERWSRLTLPPRGVRFERGECGGVPGEFVTAVAAAAPSRGLLYLHGGAYCVGSPRTHRAITGALARATGAVVFAADYRLAPEHPFPAAVDDAAAALAGLADRCGGASRVAIGGDSAGGGLAVATCLRLRERSTPLPAAVVAYSPWVDLAPVDRGAPPKGEVMLSTAWVAAGARHYLADTDPREPLASPVHAYLAGLPPVLLQVGTDELLYADSQRLHAALLAAGVHSELQVFPRRWHVFQANAGVLADADRAVAQTAQFLGERWRD